MAAKAVVEEKSKKKMDELAAKIAEEYEDDA